MRDCKRKQSLRKDSFVYLGKKEKVAELVFQFKLAGNLLEKDKNLPPAKEHKISFRDL